MDGIDLVIIELQPGTQTVLAITLAIMMLGVALGLKPEHFAFIRTSPLRVVKGALTQMIGLPLLTLGFIYVWDMPASVALGMIIVACCPGGNVSNVLTKVSGGNTAYSVSLTTVSSVLAPLYTPFAILFWSSIYAPTNALIDSIDLNAGMFLLQTSLILLLPLITGMLTAQYYPKLAAKLNIWLTRFSVFIIFLLIVVGLSTNWHLIILYGAIILPIVILHNSASFLLGWGAGVTLLDDKLSARALTFEVGIQNSGLGLVILLSQFEGLGGAALIISTWGIWHFVGGFTAIGLYNWSDRKTA